MPPTDVFSQGYGITTAKHYGKLHEMPDANNITGNRQVVAGPLGFGDAVELNKGRKQCLSIKGDKDVTHDPSLATEGFSVSLWVKAQYTEEDLFRASLYETYDKEYFVSTGGDTDGHSGISIYQQGIVLTAVVSNGSKYWQASAPGSIPNNKWTNVGMRWADTIGVELVVNSGVKAYMKNPMTTTASSDPIVVETTIGCRRDHDTTTTQQYSGFSDVEVDEYSLWERYLGSNETVYFLGGYVGEPSYFTPDIFKKVMQEVDLTKPEQRTLAVEVLNAYMEEMEKDEDEEEEYDDEEHVEEEGIHAHNSSRNATEVAARAKEFQEVANIIVQLSQPSGLRDDQTVEVTLKTLDIIGVACKLLKPKRKMDWMTAAEDGGLTVMDFVRHLEEFTLASGLAHARSFKPTTRIAVAHDCVFVELNTMKVDDLRTSAKDMVTPIHLRDDPNWEAWRKHHNHVEVPRDMYTDVRCKERKMVIASHEYTTLHKLQDHPLPVSSKSLNPKVENFLDSPVLSFSAGVTQVFSSGKIDPATPPCNPNPLKSKLKPMFTHLTKMKPLRRLLFHENLTKTKLKTRHCAWFNPNAGSRGEWQGENCQVSHSGESHTKCMCRRLGMYSVVAEMVEPMEVPEDPHWLVIVRYVLYGLSAVCLLFFIFVVAFAGDLKEQFHLMGLCLASCLLVGSFFMIMSDLEGVRTKRHVCTAIGTILHFSYLGAGAWMAMIGHASFKCVTSGIVGGKMKQYGYLAAGVTLVSVGCTYTFFLYDLGNDPRCFISWYNSPKEVFFVPQIVFCGVALFCAIVIILNLHTAAFRNKPSVDDYRSFSRGASLLIVYFCLTWSIAVVTYLHFDIEIDFYPVFQILNGLSGVMLLLCLGVCSSRFRMVLAGQAKLRKEKLRRYMDRTGERGVKKQLIAVPPSIAPSPRRVAPSPRHSAPSHTTPPPALSPSSTRPSSNTLEVPGLRPRSNTSIN